MASLLLAGRDEAELAAMRRAGRELAARTMADALECHCFSRAGDVDGFLQAAPGLDAAGVDITLENGTGLARQVRAAARDAFLFLVASPEISPVTYMRPDILAASLLLRPYTPEQLGEVLRQVLLHIGGGQEESFSLHSREGHRAVAYRRIRYFEARQKKVLLCTGGEEYGFYDTLDKLAERLPPQFVRCHRSFIVHKGRVARLMLSQNLLELDDGTLLPLSRSYKAALKELI